LVLLRIAAADTSRRLGRPTARIPIPRKKLEDVVILVRDESIGGQSRNAPSSATADPSSNPSIDANRSL
jgi:hypothetical protein